MRGTKYGRQGKMSKCFTFFTTFLTTFMLVIISFDSSEGDFGLVQNWGEGAEIPVLWIVLTYCAISKFSPDSVCHICASQKFIYENLGNYLKNVWCCPHWSLGRFRKENRDFWNSNTAILAVPPKWPHIQALEISIIWLYLNATFSFRPKMLGVDAHLYRLLSPQI